MVGESTCGQWCCTADDGQQLTAIDGTCNQAIGHPSRHRCRFLQGGQMDGPVFTEPGLQPIAANGYQLLHDCPFAATVFIPSSRHQWPRVKPRHQLILVQRGEHPRHAIDVKRPTTGDLKSTAGQISQPCQTFKTSSRLYRFSPGTKETHALPTENHVYVNKCLENRARLLLREPCGPTLGT
jgi:hypothetical protein